jgi:hypothetical protein
MIRTTVRFVAAVALISSSSVATARALELPPVPLTAQLKSGTIETWEIMVRCAGLAGYYHMAFKGKAAPKSPPSFNALAVLGLFSQAESQYIDANPNSSIDQTKEIVAKRLGETVIAYENSVSFSKARRTYPWSKTSLHGSDLQTCEQMYGGKQP